MILLLKHVSNLDFIGNSNWLWQGNRKNQVKRGKLIVPMVVNLFIDVFEDSGIEEVVL